MKNRKLLLCHLLLLLVFASFCIRKDGINFAGAQKEKGTALSAVGDAAQSFNLSSEDCTGPGNVLSAYYFDNDRDSFGDKEKVQYMCSDSYSSEFAEKENSPWVEDNTDCDDTNKKINPDATEICDDNELDEDCDGVVDPEVAYLDADKDGLGNMNSAFETKNCMLPPAQGDVSYVFNNNDCDDTDEDVGAATEYYVDGDSDGFGKSGSDATSSCSQPDGWVANDEDCDDGDAQVKTSESDPNMEDKDCDGVDDLLDLCSGTSSSLLDDDDKDKDGCWGEEDCNDDSLDPNQTRNLDNDCDGVLAELDCDDNDSSEKGTNTENNLDCDNYESDVDCDDNDASSTNTETDADCDGYLNTSAAVETDGSYYNSEFDCDDTDDNKPSLDKDCDGISSSNDCDDSDSDNTSEAQTWYKDNDGDGSGSLSDGIYACSNTLDSSLYVADSTDSCDNDASRTVSGNDNDIDCDGICDGGSTSVELDVDCDGECDTGGGSADFDKNCDGKCDKDPDLSSLFDSDCDGTCDSDTDGSGNSSYLDIDCDSYCNYEESTAQVLLTLDADCDGVCDEGTDGSGNSSYVDTDCDSYCNYEDSTAQVSLTLDADCDGMCDEGTEGDGQSLAVDSDCDSYCDDSVEASEAIVGCMDESSDFYDAEANVPGCGISETEFTLSTNDDGLPKLGALGRVTTFSSYDFEIDGVTYDNKRVVYMNPGQEFSFTVEYTMVRTSSSSNCPGCITQHYIGVSWNDTAAEDEKCLFSRTGSQSSSDSKTLSWTAPDTPGTYAIRGGSSWAYYCRTDKNKVSAATSGDVIAIIIVGRDTDGDGICDADEDDGCLYHE